MSRRWTLAEIKESNQSAGFHFFERSTMRFFGDTMRSFGVRHIGDKVFVIRLRPMRDSSGRNRGGIGDMREFNQSTGDIGLVRRDS